MEDEAEAGATRPSPLSTLPALVRSAFDRLNPTQRAIAILVVVLVLFGAALAAVETRRDAGPGLQLGDTYLWPASTTSHHATPEAVANAFLAETVGRPRSVRRVADAPGVPRGAASVVAELRDDRLADLFAVRIGDRWWVSFVKLAGTDDLVPETTTSGNRTTIGLRPPPGTTAGVLTYASRGSTIRRVLTHGQLARHAIRIVGPRPTSLLVVFRDGDGRLVGLTGTSKGPT